MGKKGITRSGGGDMRSNLAPSSSTTHWRRPTRPTADGECRALVDQLCVENAALRAALGAAHAPPPPPPDAPQKTMENGTAQHSRALSVEQDADE